MKKTLYKTAMMAALASLTLSGNVWAHHPLSIINPALFERIEAIIADTNSNHNDVVGEVEDYDFMGQMEDNAAVDTPTNQSQVVGGATNSNMTVSQGSTGAQAGAGIGSRNRNR